MALKKPLTFRKIGEKKKKDTIPKHFPTKKTINLATVGEKPFNVKLAIPGIAAIIIAATLFGKFAVADRLLAVSDAQRQVDVVRMQVEAGHEKIEEYGDMTEEYAHYTYSGMTEEEIARVDRNDILMLLRRSVLPEVTVSSWTLQDNQMEIIITGSKLQTVNLLVQRLETEELVDFCTVQTAATNTNETGSNMDMVVNTSEAVTAQLTIYFKNYAPEEDE